MNKKKILLVDDDMLMLKLINRILVNAQFEVLEAKNGEEALTVIEEQEKSDIDLIITDYEMPIINGLEFANIVKTHKIHCDIPLILITSNSDIKKEKERKYNVFNEILYKPVVSELLLSTVRDLLKG